MRAERKVDRTMTESFRLGLCRILAAVVVWAVVGATSEAADKTAGVLSVRDALTLPNHSVRIEAQLNGKASTGGQPLGGVVLHLRIDGKEMSTGKTNDAGQASFDYLPKMRGTNVISVSVDEAAPIVAEKNDATLCVWERRRPILVVELAALIQPTLTSTTSAASSSPPATGEGAPAPVSEAADELSRLTRYYYNVVYVPGGESWSMRNESIGQVRRWLESHKFPPGFVAAPSSGGLSAILDTFKQNGWTTMKSGIGRTKGFAETLLQHRMEVVVVPELPKGELPRKAKAAKDWKEVRKKL